MTSLSCAKIAGSVFYQIDFPSPLNLVGGTYLGLGTSSNAKIVAVKGTTGCVSILVWATDISAITEIITNSTDTNKNNWLVLQVGYFGFPFTMVDMNMYEKYSSYMNYIAPYNKGWTPALQIQW